MNDLGMDFRVNPEISNFTDAFDYSTDPNTILNLLASDTAGYGFANPTAMYQGYFAGQNNMTYSGLTDAQMTAIGQWSTYQVNIQQGLGTMNAKSLDQSMALMN